MTVAAVPVSSGGDALGDFNYLEPSVQHSLYRNGQVLTRRDPAGSDGGTEGVVLEARTMTIRNARLQLGSDRRTVESNGFELLNPRLMHADIDFFDHLEVVKGYYRECEALVRETTGTAHVFAFDHNVRSAAGKQSQRPIRGGQQVQGPAYVVHGDYTLRSAPERLQQLARPPSGNDTLCAVIEPGEALVKPRLLEQALQDRGRFAFINVWRNIADEPVATHPLALCDGQSVDPEALVVFEIHYQDRVGENYFAKHSSRHQWYYYPALTRDEAVLIKQWDSAGTLARSQGELADHPQAPCTFSFHSAFEDPSTPPDAPERWSIEVRCIVIYA